MANKQMSSSLRPWVLVKYEVTSLFSTVGKIALMFTNNIRIGSDPAGSTALVLNRLALALCDCLLGYWTQRALFYRELQMWCWCGSLIPDRTSQSDETLNESLCSVRQPKFNQGNSKPANPFI